MPDEHSYAQMRRQFGEILRQDRRRRRQFQLTLLIFHLLLVLGAPVYVWWRNQAMHETIGVFFTEALLVLWLLLWASLLLHVATVFFLTRSRVAETVHESLLLMVSGQGQPEVAARPAEKPKRDRLDDDEAEVAFYSDDESVFTSRHQR